MNRAVSGASATCSVPLVELRRSSDAVSSRRASYSSPFNSGPNGRRRRRRHAAAAFASASASSSTDAPRGFGPRTWEEPVAAVASSVIPAPPNLSGQALRSNWNATALAYLGDAVWELYARRAHFAPPKRLTALYDLVTASVRAEAQAAFAERLEAGGFLSDDEKEVLRWGRNAKVTMPKRFVGGKAKDNGPRGGGGKGKKDHGVDGGASTAALGSSSSSPKTVVSGPHANVYRAATALECLVGYLYVTDARRLHAVMRYLGLGGPEEGSEGGGLAAAVLAAAAGREGGGAFGGSSNSSSSNSGGNDDEEDSSNDNTSIT